MSISAERKTALVSQYATKAGDTGSPEVQVAILTERINNLTGHFKSHVKDNLRAAACSRWFRSAVRCLTMSRARTRPATGP
jgi:hypothetical protein